MRLIALFLALALFSCQTDKENNMHDLAFVNSKIWTGNEQNPWTSWITVDANRIKGVGTEAKPDAGKVIDLKDANVDYTIVGGRIVYARENESDD